ncbi:MAG: protein-glutamate methylesterase/protein-glutamine glutaminase [Bacteroidales bacterium]
MNEEKRKIKVLIVDDSALVRKVLSDIFTSDPMIEVIDTAIDPLFAMKKMQTEMPDVITLDIEMPRMDGLTFLRYLRSRFSIPVVIISSLTTRGAEAAIRAMEFGAVEIITKPQLHNREMIEEARVRLCDIIKAASEAKLNKVSSVHIPIVPKLSADAVLPFSVKATTQKNFDTVIAIGASTGGTEALRILLEKMPADCPGIVIVQHMPEHFTRSFANRLNDLCTIYVKEAEDGDIVSRGQALIAPGNKHMLLKSRSGKYYIEIKDGPLVNRHRPSVDVLFRSAARYAGTMAIGVILTGMGDDGAKGMLEMKQAGARTIAQNEQTCVVFGMPKEAIKLNAVDQVLPLEEIPGMLIKWFHQTK